MQTGRREIFTDYPEITKENIIKILRQAYVTHTANAYDCDSLIKFEKGEQPLTRVKTYRSDINNECVDNVANEITEFKLSFHFGNPITFVQRGKEPIQKHITDKELLDSITLLNDCYNAQGGNAKTLELARFMEICGVGYVFVDMNDKGWQEGDSYFTVDALDPRYTFVVKSSGIGHKPMLGVTYRQDENGNKFFSCFTETNRFEIVNTYKFVENEKEAQEIWSHANRSGEANPFSIIPIIEYVRAHDRMGVFERQISEMQNLNLLVSDFSNDVDQNTQSIWHTNDVDFPKDANGNEISPKSGDWLRTFTTPDGKQPQVTPLAVNYDYPGMLQNIITRRSLILQKCAVPQRNDNSGGSTGIAMSDATGWSAAESAACKEQVIFESAKMQELKVVLTILKMHPRIEKDNPLLKLRYTDCKPSIKRQKTYEMTTKANFMATLISHGFNGEHVIKASNAFDDPNQVWIDSKKGIEAFQDKLYAKDETVGGEGGDGEEKPDKDKIAQDESDQESNSPMIGGMSKNDN